MDETTILGRTLELDDEKTAAIHVAAYEKFHKWVEGGALESVRCELSGTLFPVFAHCFLRIVQTEAEASGGGEDAAGEPPSRAFLERWGPSHGDRFGVEVEALRLVTSPKVAAGDAYCARLLRSVFLVTLSDAAVDLMGDFLMRTGNAAVLKIVNERVVAERGGERGGGERAAAVLVDAEEEAAAQGGDDGEPSEPEEL